MRYLSLFSGMEAAHLSWAPLGWECVAVAEIDPAACALLRHRLPEAPNLGSVSDITDEQIKALGAIDVVIGGSPCQDLSVAGRRAGLGGARSSLFHQQMRIFNAARHFCGARWLVWENVPGAFSSNQGRDFAVVVGAMAGSELPVPAGGWGSEGVALGDNGLVEWAVLDAQWFGVAQRRRRVFAVLDTGNWSDRPPVLLEPDRMRGDSAPRRRQGERPAPTLTAGAGSSHGPGIRAEVDGGTGLIQQVAGTLSANPKAAGSATQQDAHAGLLIPAVAHTLRADGVDASEDGTGRGTPLVPVVAFAQNQRDEVREVTVAGALAAQPGMKQTTYLAFGCKDSDPTRSVSEDVSPTLRAMGHVGSHANAGGQVAVAYTTKLHNTSSNNAGKVFEERTTCLDANSPAPALLTPTQVRRLTPIECERLQGAPDNWTLVLNPKGKPMADGPRYKILGNSFAVPVIRWIGTRIDAATQAALEKAA